MKFLLTIGFSVLMAFSLHAQRVLIGTVTSEDGETLIGATVQVKGASGGTVTDVDGNYSINVPEKDGVLLISFIGYTSQEIKIGEQQRIDAVLQTGQALGEVIVTGSRGAGRTKLTTAVPVDVLDIKQLIGDAPQTNINQILNYLAPSFSSNTQTISDGSDHIDPASLRGLGPDQVLVLINGKRRHNSSLVNVNGTFGRGSVGTDLNAIPAAAIDRIEILRDGAAAQYGSDAIAGVINIIMRSSTDELFVNFTTGAYASEGSNAFTGGLDGEQYDLSLNYGLPLGDNGGFINFTGNFESRGWTTRMRELRGNLFHTYNGVERLASERGLDPSRLSIDQVRDLSQDLPYLTSTEKDFIKNADEADLRATSDQNPLFGDATDEELGIRGLERSDFNMRVGQSQIRGGKLFFNMEYPVGQNAAVYAFGGLSARNGEAAGFYRLPNQSRAYSPAYPNGFLPEIHSNVIDQSLAVGIRGNVKGWDVDFSNNYGSNSFLYNVRNTNNATLQNATPFEFLAGGFAFSQNTTNFDLRRYYGDVLYGLNVAMGAEYRQENYEIIAGSEDSHASYDINGQPVTSTTPSELLVTDFFGRSRPGGAQVFPGFQPANELDESRNSAAVYVDVEADLTEAFMVSLAGRLENYSDFGSTANAKAAARYKLSNNISVRGAASTGFRAPSLAQIYFNSTSTLFVDGVPFEVGTFSNNSRIARILGIPELKEETSVSFSAGVTALVPDANLSITVDAFRVDIDDRVVLTGQFAPGDNAELQRLFAQANAERATFFSNAIDTRTEGIDVVLAHEARLGGKSKLLTSLAATFFQTRQQGDIKASPELEPLRDTYFDETSRLFLEEAVPRTKANLTFNLQTGKFSIFLRNVYFGEVTEATNNLENQQTFGAKIVTDLSLGYELIDGLRISAGANNLLDVYPDENIPANQGAGQFLYSRRSQQFGFQGRFIFARLTWNM